MHNQLNSAESAGASLLPGSMLQQIGAASRRSILRWLATATGLALFAAASSPDASGQLLVTYFNFNDSNLVSDGGAQPATITTDFVPSNVIYTTGTTLNRAFGEPAGQALTLQNGADGVNNGRFIQFSVNTTALEDLMLSYATVRSTTGFTTQTLSYSTDNITFTTFEDRVVPDAFGVVSFDLSSVGAIENQPSLTFRLTFTGGSTTTAIGSNRIDNLQVTAVPEPSVIFGGVALVGLVVYRERRRFGYLLRQGTKPRA